jgi:hypothetical protein
MRKYLLILLAIVTLGFTGYKAFALTTTMTDLFATGDDGSGGPLFRIDQYGGILTGSSGDLTITGNDLTFGNAETISNSTNGLIRFTDGSNVLAVFSDDGTTGSLYFGSSSRNIKDGTYAIAVSTDLTTPKLYFGSSSRSIADGTYNIAVSTEVSAPVFKSTTGKYSATTAVGQTSYTVYLATVIPNTNSFPLTLADGKAGWFDVMAGTYCIKGTFTTAAVVSLSTGCCSTDTSATDNNALTVNAYDGGSIVYIENQSNLTASPTFHVRYGWIE